MLLRILLTRLAMSTYKFKSLELETHLCRLAYFLPDDFPFASFVLLDSLSQGLTLDYIISVHNRD